MATESFETDAFLRGVLAGVDRASRYGVLARLDDTSAFAWRQAPEWLGSPSMPRPLGDDMTYVRGLLRDTQASDRFAEMFGEMATVAVIAREAYGDPALGRDEILSYEAHSSAFFNSFRHA